MGPYFLKNRDFPRGPTPHEKTKNQGTQIQTQHFLTPTAKIRTSYDDILLLLLLFFFSFSRVLTTLTLWFLSALYHPKFLPNLAT